MKRFFTVLLVLLLTLSLAACVAAPSEKPGDAAGGNTTQDTTQNTTQDTTENVQNSDNKPAGDSKPTGDSKPADTPAVTGPVDEKQAKEIALKHAGVSADTLRDYEIEKEQLGGVTFFEIDFESGDYEYEYLIRVDNGKILESSKELDRD